MAELDRREFVRHCAQACTACLGAVVLGCATRSSSNASAERAATTMNNPEWDISFCGLNCAKCKLLVEGKCAGCRGPIEKNWSGNCEFRPCATEKGHTYCFECVEFPCERLKAFAEDGYDHHRLAVANLGEMREKGLDAWIASQPKVMFCPGWLF